MTGRPSWGRVLALVGVLATPADVAAQGCPAGQLRHADTEGNCCWPDQAWNGSRCVGAPDCPAGMAAVGDTCEASRCPGAQVPIGDICCESGQIASRGNCCWPGQGWLSSKGRCVGTPTCPPGTTATGDACSSGGGYGIPPTTATPPSGRQYPETTPTVGGAAAQSDGGTAGWRQSTTASQTDSSAASYPAPYSSSTPYNTSAPPATASAPTGPATRGAGSASPPLLPTWNSALSAHDYRFISAPAGSFQMGSPPTEQNRDDDERQHGVVFRQAYLIGVTEVTQGLYQDVMGENPAQSRAVSQSEHALTSCATAGVGPQLPVTCVTWYDAVRFCNRLSELEGLMPAYTFESASTVTWNFMSNGYRLPTEAEWEYAARAGQATIYAGSDNPDEVGWYIGNSEWRVRAVASLRPNAWGMYDMSGNVREWVWDWYGPYPQSNVIGPTGVHNGDAHVYRSGSWANAAHDTRVADRGAKEPGTIWHQQGFRIARSLPEPE